MSKGPSPATGGGPERITSRFAPLFKLPHLGPNQDPVAAKKGLTRLEVAGSAVFLVGLACSLSDFMQTRQEGFSQEELTQATEIASRFALDLNSNASALLIDSGFAQPSFTVIMEKTDTGRIQPQLLGAVGSENTFFLTKVIDGQDPAKIALVLSNLTALADNPRSTDLIRLGIAANGKDLIGKSEEGSIVMRIKDAWIDGVVNPNAQVELMTVNSNDPLTSETGLKPMTIINSKAPTVAIDVEINPENENETLSSIADQINFIPPTPDGLPIISDSIAVATPASNSTSTPEPSPTNPPSPTATKELSPEKNDETLVPQLENPIVSEEATINHPDFAKIKMTQLQLYMTGESKTINKVGFGDLLVIKLAYRDINNRVVYVWMEFGGYDFGGKHDSVLQLNVRTGENPVENPYASLDDLAKKYVKRGNMVNLNVIRENARANPIPLECYSLIQLCNNTPIDAEKGFALYPEENRQLARGEAVENPDFILSPAIFIIIQ